MKTKNETNGHITSPYKDFCWGGGKKKAIDCFFYGQQRGVQCFGVQNKEKALTQIMYMSQRDYVFHWENSNICQKAQKLPSFRKHLNQNFTNSLQCHLLKR